MKNKRRILATSALPYANGSIHIGHLVEYIQTDIWTRFQKIRGHECFYICADDTHGTAIMLKARDEGVTPEELIKKMNEEHQQDFSDFHIQFDNYYSTHSDENRELASLIYNRLQKSNHITSRIVTQAYDPIENMFLPDRFIKGNCPKCNAPDQYGDNCEKCGGSYSSNEMTNAISTISGVKPIEKESEHYFFKLGNFEGMLKEWTRNNHLQIKIINKLDEWFDVGLKEWDISRDAPYFGFEIPGHPGKYFYVWLDAPIGYMASFMNFCKKNNIDFDDYWKEDSDTEVYHFIGKDIVYFHALFWPAILHGSNYRTPTAIFCHGFLTVNGSKMSKSRGTFIKARTYLDHLNPEYLRYYFAAKLSDDINDIDLNFEDFSYRVNSDLVGKVINIASRCSGFINKFFSGKLSSELSDLELFNAMIIAGDTIAKYYEQRKFSYAVKEIMILADRTNQYIEIHKPWIIAKDKNKRKELQNVCTMGLNLFRLIIGYLEPILPITTKNSEKFLNTEFSSWESLKNPLLDHIINPFETLMVRVKKEEIDNVLESSKEDLLIDDDSQSFQNIKDEISIDDFYKLDLRVAKIIKAESVFNTKKMMRLELDLGDGICQVFSAINTVYSVKNLENKLVVVLVNLKSKKMKCGESKGMILGGINGDDIYLLSPDIGAKAGMKIG